MSERTDQIGDITKQLGVRLAYGERLELGGEQVIPVALWAGGAGEGSGEANKGDVGAGEGMGFGGVAVPVGAYVGGNYGVHFRPNLIALLCAITPLVAVTGWALPRLIKALKK